MKLVKARRVTQVAFLLFFLILFLRARFPYSDVPPSDLYIRFSPLIPLFDFIEHFRLYMLFWPALLILVLTPFLGRFFCGWICPLGTTLDGVSHAVHSPTNKTSSRFNKLRFLKFGILVGTLLLALFSVNVWGYFDPLSIFNRGLTVLFYPLFTLAAENVLLGLTYIPFLEDQAYGIYTSYKAVIMPEAQGALQQVFWVALFVGGILGLEKLSRRFWCRYLCPAGAFLGFLSQYRLFERIVSDTCPSCMLCEKECKMNAIPEGISTTDKVECIECFGCEEICPTKIDAISYRWRWRPYHTSVDYSRRRFLQTSVSSFAALGLLSIGLRNPTREVFAIRPPGALPEEEFRDACIRCQECVRICSSNGRTLQPDGIRNS
ncbi:4Fe-4S binding protein, partial [Candidatus Neomarinimicrobiota bacterium]